MNPIVTLLTALLLAPLAALHAAEESPAATKRASDFGFNPTNATVALQAAIWFVPKGTLIFEL